AVCQERHRGTSPECGRNVSETSSRYSDRMTVTPSTTAGAPRTEGMNYYTRKWVRPEDLNANGTLFGGSLLRWIDEEAAIYAIIQLGNHRVVTKLISEMDLRAAPRDGGRIEMGLSATHVGRTSLTMEAVLRNMTTRKSIRSIARIVFVGVRETGWPIPHGYSTITYDRDRMPQPRS